MALYTIRWKDKRGAEHKRAFKDGGNADRFFNKKAAEELPFLGMDIKNKVTTEDLASATDSDDGDDFNYDLSETD